jgi:ribosomal protein L40E
LNRASNAKAAYTIAISFGKSAIVNVTTYSTLVESSVQSTVVTETVVQTQEIQGLFSGQNGLFIVVGIGVVVLLFAVLAFKARSGKKTPRTQTAGSQVVGKSFCVNCGAELHPNKKFCGKCGKPVY